MKTLKAILEDPFAQSLGIEVVKVEAGYANLRMKITAKHLNAGGVCHGGALFALADLAFAAAVNSHRQLTLLLNAAITYLRAAREGTVYAEAVELYHHNRIPYAEVSIRDEEGELIARFTSSGYRKQEELEIDELM